MSAASLNRADHVWRPRQVGQAHMRVPAFASVPGSLSVTDGRIAGFDPDPSTELQIDCAGATLIPGFVDPHTHLPFAGWREREFAMKIAGESYEAIARRGGGIRSSAVALRQASDEEVLTQARALQAEMLAHGTTTFEGKTGYGLSTDGELRSLRLGVELGADRMTALLAHAIPDGYAAERWMDEVAGIVPRLQGASALDIYVESVAFGNEHLARMGELAREQGLDLRAHVEQFNHNGSVPAGIEAGACSLDHLACATAGDVRLLADSETAAVLLPGAEFLGAERTAPGAGFAQAGAICVLGTDLNPGTSPIVSMPLVIGLAVRRYGWSAEQALAAATLNAAWVLRLHPDRGSLELGKRGDVAVLDGPFERVPYRFGHNPVELVLRGGELVHLRPGSEWRVTRT